MPTVFWLAGLPIIDLHKAVFNANLNPNVPILYFWITYYTQVENISLLEIRSEIKFIFHHFWKHYIERAFVYIA